MQLPVACPHCAATIDPERVYLIDPERGHLALPACPECGGLLPYAEQEWEFDPEGHADPEPHAEECELPTPDASGASPTENVWENVSIRPRERPPDRSLLRRILPPVLGGLAAVPIALAILWYGFGRDIGNAGPTIAKYVPWVVPRSLQGGARRDFSRSMPSVRPNDERRFGHLGSQSQSRPSEGRPRAHAPRDESREEPASWEELASQIHAFHADRAARDVDGLLDSQGKIYRSICNFAEGIATGHDLKPGASTVDVALSRTFGELLDEAWFAESIRQAAAGQRLEIPTPGHNDCIVWIADEVGWPASGGSRGTLQMSPPHAIQSLPARWSYTARWSVNFDGQNGSTSSMRPSDRPVLLYGRVERRDESGFEIRLEGIVRGTR